MQKGAQDFCTTSISCPMQVSISYSSYFKVVLGQFTLHSTHTSFKLWLILKLDFTLESPGKLKKIWCLCLTLKD